MMIVPAKCVRSWFRAVRTIRPGWPAPCKMSSTAQDIKMLRRQMDATTRFDTLMNAMMEQNKNISSQYLKLSAETTSRFETLSSQTSSRIDKFAGSQLIALGVVVTVVIAGVGYLDGKNTQLDRKIETGMKEMDRKIEEGNAQLKVEMKEMDRKIEAGNAQLKEKMDRKIEAGNAQLKEQMDRKIEAGNAQLKKDLLEALTGKENWQGK
jgi:hypothetical protein